MIDDSELYCEVKTANGIFRDWTAVSVRYSVEHNYMRLFQLELAEVSPPGGAPALLAEGGAGARIMQRLAVDDRCSIYLGGQPVIVDGFIKTRQAAYDATRHAVQVTGIAKSGDIGEVSVDVPGGQFRDYTLSSIAKRILQPLGVRFSLINPPSGADLPFRNVIVAPGESIGNMLMRLAHQRGCWLWTDVNGDILAGNPPGSGTAVLEEGRNILSAASYVENPAAEFVYSRAQTFGSDHLWGRDAAEISSKAEIAGANAAKGKKIITLAEEPGTQRDTQLRANFEVQAIDSNLRRDTITHRGWFRPGSGTLWKEGDYCTVKSPMLYPHNDGVSNLRVWNVSCSQSDEAGTTTTVDLVNDAAYSQQHPDGTKASPYDRSASLAVPETYV